MKFAIDRIEEGMAILIGRNDETVRMTIPVSDLPPGSREGDILNMILEKDPGTTAAAKERVAGLIEKMKKKQ